MDTIITPGNDDITINPPVQEQKYLLIDNNLSEFIAKGAVDAVISNLGLDARFINTDDYNSLYNRVSNVIKTLNDHINDVDDPHNIQETLEDSLKNYVKTDGSPSFTSIPEAQGKPIKDNHLTTKSFVDNLLKQHVLADDPHNIIEQVDNKLASYTKKSDLNNIYNKKEVYNKKEIDDNYIRRDGTKAFTKPQSGVDPIAKSHLSTKRYVDKVMDEHLNDSDPHSFYAILNNRLASYIKRKDVYDKTQTYSRTQIDALITELVDQVVEATIRDYLSSVNDKLEYIRKQHYIKTDGSTPFLNPQKGVAATADDELVTLGQIKEQESSQMWVTSGPVETTVGFVEDNMQLPKQMTMQEIFDAIFYNRGASIEIQDTVIIGNKTPITICISGSADTIELVEVLQNDKFLASFTKEDFAESSCITIDSDVITSDTDIVVRVTYTNGTEQEFTEHVICSLPVFVGLLPYRKFGSDISYNYLVELTENDPVNNKFYTEGPNLSSLTHQYSFSGKDVYKFIVAMPMNYPNLKTMNTSAQEFSIDAFDVIDIIADLQIPIDNDKTIPVAYKFYIYKQKLARSSSSVTFNFTGNE